MYPCIMQKPVIHVAQYYALAISSPQKYCGIPSITPDIHIIKIFTASYTLTNSLIAEHASHNIDWLHRAKYFKES